MSRLMPGISDRFAFNFELVSMNRWRMNFWSTLFFVLIAFSCSKKSDPVPTGCNFTFKGTTYSIADVTCTELQGIPSLSSASTALTQELTLINGTLKSISFVSSPDPDSYYRSDLTSIAPTITIAGKVWTFSGTLENGIGGSGTISGSCTCQN